MVSVSVECKDAVYVHYTVRLKIFISKIIAGRKSAGLTSEVFFIFVNFEYFEEEGEY